MVSRSMLAAPLLARTIPHPLQNVPAMDLVIERVEPTSRIGLGRPVERSLQFSDFVLPGGPSHDVALTGPSLCATRERSSGPSLTGGSVVRPARSVLRPPPTPSRHPFPFPAQTGYRTGRSGSNSQATGPGRASPVPAATISTFRAPYAGRFLRTRSRISRPFHGLRRDTHRLGTSSSHPQAGL